MLFFISVIWDVFGKLVYLSRVAFVLPDLNKYKQRENKRAGGPENGLFDTFIDSICVWPYSY